MIQTLCIISQAFLIAKIIDHVYLHHYTFRQTLYYLYGLVALYTLRAGAAAFKEWSGFISAQTIKKQIRFFILNHLLKKNPDTIAQHQAGHLTTALLDHVESVHEFYSNYLPQLFISLIIPFTIIGLVLLKNTVAGLILLICCPLIPLFMALIGMGVTSLTQRQFQSLSRLSTHFLDILQGLSTLTLFNRAEAQTKSVHDKSDAYREKTMNVLKVAFLSSAVLELFSTVSIAMIAVYLGLGLLGFVHIGFAHHLISLQDAFFILLLAPECFAPLRSLGAFYHARSEAIAAANELLKITETPAQENQENTDYLLDNIDIKCHDLHFAYVDQDPLFSNLTAHIPANKITLLVGPSGSGKTTLLKMLCQFQPILSGHLLVNNLDLSHIAHENWLQHISYLSQHPYLFHDTVLNNITLHENYPDYAIQEAAYCAGVLDFASQLPNGLQTLIGEQYLGLSGGQAQRVALARALLKNAPLILLDEPTAHLDHHSKQFILDAVLQWKNNKTIVIATHDSAFLSIADHGIDLTPTAQEIPDENTLVLC